MRVLLWICGFAAVLLLGALSLSSFFTVDRTEFVYVTQFGQHVATLDGENDVNGNSDAGWHWKLPWPIQSVQRIDHRLQVFDLPETEVLTHDPKGRTVNQTLTVTAYVCWRISDRAGVDQFVRSVGTPDEAKKLLGREIGSRIGAAISNMPIEDLIGIATEQRAEERINQLRDRLLGTGPDGLTTLTRRAYGIELVDVRLRRFNHPVSVREEIFNRIRSERGKKAQDYRNEGEMLRRDILSLAEREAADTLTRARNDAERLRKEADVKADEIRNEAHAKDPDFYAFLQKLKTYQAILGETKDILLLSSKHELFDLLLKPPKPANGTEPKLPAENGAAPKTGGQ
jgi:membrane protease subunit HflC